MKVQCPHCGGTVEVNGLGRKAFNMPVTKARDAARLHRIVFKAAKELGWLRVAQKYTETTGVFISKQTCKRRYLEVKENH